MISPKKTSSLASIPKLLVILPCIVCYTLILDGKTLYIYYIAIQRYTPIRFRLDSHRLPIKPIAFLVNHPKKGYSS